MDEGGECLVRSNPAVITQNKCCNMSTLSGMYCQALFLAFEIVCDVAAMQIFSVLAPQALKSRPPQDGKRISS